MTAIAWAIIIYTISKRPNIDLGSGFRLVVIGIIFVIALSIRDLLK